MLDDAEREAFLDAIERVRAQAAHALREAPSALHAVRFVSTLHRGVDLASERSARAGPAPACQAGCSHCCHARVEATEPEIFWMARWVGSQPPSYRDELLSRLRSKLLDSPMDVHPSVDGHPSARRPSACAFLVDNLCSAYEARPAACRRAHSLSAEPCAEGSAHIPQNLALVVEAEAMMAGTAHGYRDAGLSAAATELTAGMLAALGDASSEQAWLARGGKF